MHILLSIYHIYIPASILTCQINMNVSKENEGVIHMKDDIAVNVLLQS